MATDDDLIGRGRLDDLDAILAVANTDTESAVHAVPDTAAAIFTWDYEKGERRALNRLYEKAKTSQWNGETDLPWDTEIDQEALPQLMLPSFGLQSMDLADTPFARWGDTQWVEFGIESQNWAL